MKLTSVRAKFGAGPALLGQERQMVEKVEDERMSDKCLPILVHKFCKDRWEQQLPLEIWPH